jgi:hypothetical protein
VEKTSTLSTSRFIFINKVEKCCRKHYETFFGDTHHHKMTQGNAKRLGASYWHVKLFYGAIICKEMGAPRQVIWVQFICNKYIEDRLLGHDKISRSASHLSFHSCKYGSFIGLCLFRPWAICFYVCGWCYTFGFHADSAAMFDTHYCLDDVDHRNAVRIPVH